jgi:hypothetical protein
MCKLVDEGGPVAKCVKDDCAGQQCDDPWVCKGGTCIQDPCNTVGCETGEVCVDGECIADPCLDVRCPVRFRCELGMCVADNVESTKEILATGSGGLACAVSPGSGASPGQGASAGCLVLFFAVALLIVIRRRKIIGPKRG